MTWITYKKREQLASAINDSLDRCRAAKFAYEAAKAAYDDAKNELRPLIDQCPGKKFMSDHGRASITPTARAGLDTKGLRRDLWDVVAPYATVTEYDALNIRF